MPRTIPVQYRHSRDIPIAARFHSREEASRVFVHFLLGTGSGVTGGIEYANYPDCRRNAKAFVDNVFDEYLAPE
jgi:hypothetical protein